MKKLYAIVCAVALLLMMCGCSSDGDIKDYQVLTCDFSDSFSGASLEREYNYWYQNTFDTSKVEPLVVVDVAGAQHIGTFNHASLMMPNSYPVYQYTDEDENTFSVDPDGKLTSYFWNRKEGNDQSKKSEKVCAEIARTFLEQFTDVELYQLETKYDGEQGHYQYTFTKYIDGYETADSARITVKETGELYIFSSSMLGKIPMDTKITIDKKAVEKAVFKKLDSAYAGVKSEFDKIEYEIVSNYVTILESGEIAAVCTVDVNCLKRMGKYYEDCGERFSFVVTKNAID